MKTLRLALRPFLVSLQRTKNRLFAPDLLLYTNTAITVAMSISGDLMQQHYQAIKKPKAPDWDKRRTTHMALAGSFTAWPDSPNYGKKGASGPVGMLTGIPDVTDGESRSA
ncbi:hypothetical protein C0Q70_19294 [Pomacea canaliculata]|uniref:Uncharacterized protein n=1 Tax=Pomacea canaliculata TaxID=400727 RepID=A0A2T7NIZ8_POMCA|nr:hypothetical protein C0Q70_19294 [Pomacea canaliculata]